MPISLTCNGCQHSLRVGDQHAGKRIRCPKCKDVLQVPIEEIEEVEEREEEDAYSLSAPPDEPRRSKKKKRKQISFDDIPAPKFGGGISFGRSSEREEDHDWHEEGSYDRRDWTNHEGGRLPKSLWFFVDPPAEIGPVFNAFSTLKKGTRPWSKNLKRTLLVASLIVGFFASLLLIYFAEVESWGWRIAWVVIGLGLGALIGFSFDPFQHRLTYVGRDGIALIETWGDLDHIEERVLIFDDADDMFMEITPAGDNAIRFLFQWKTEDGKTVFEVDGRFPSIVDLHPKEANLIYFANAASFAWARYRTPQIFEELNDHGRVRFRCSRFFGQLQSLEVAEDYIAFVKKGNKKAERWWSEDIQEIDLTGGGAGGATLVLRFRHVDAQEGWLSKSGVYEIQCQEIANLESVMHLLHVLHGMSLD